MKPNRKEYVVADKPVSCSECLKRATCKKLCDTAERWVSQDYVGASSNVVMQNGLGVGTPGIFGQAGDGQYNDWIDMMATLEGSSIVEGDIESDWDKWDEVQGMRLSEKITRFIFSYYVMGRRIRDIAIMEGSSSQAIDQRHIQAKKVIARKLKLAAGWIGMRDKVVYKSILDYDVSRLYFEKKYPRKAIASILRIHLSNVGKRIARQINQLHGVNNG